MGTQRRRTLQRIFSTVLDRPDVGPDENFFDLGGNSVMAMAVVERVRAELGGKVNARTFYKWPTIAGIDENVVFGGDDHG
ncbi:acyl carrier protein [Nonomuraea sp. NBC_01738]|nr:acyl carrier protein [Nonomuraea sp. NBC_01738]